jgi:hypothetical protein
MNDASLQLRMKPLVKLASSISILIPYLHKNIVLTEKQKEVEGFCEALELCFYFGSKLGDVGDEIDPFWDLLERLGSMSEPLYEYLQASIQTILSIPAAKTIHRARALIRSFLNSQRIEYVFQCIMSKPALLEEYYESWALYYSQYSLIFVSRSSHD